MSRYQTILVAVDLTDEAAEVIDAAQTMAKEQQAELHVLTTIRPLSYAYSGFEPMAISPALINFESQAQQGAEEWLNKLCEPLGIDKKHIHSAIGEPADQIKSQAKALKADLIVVGSHGRKGLGLLLGSTANGVLHGATVDVLTVRISSDK